MKYKITIEEVREAPSDAEWKYQTEREVYTQSIEDLDVAALAVWLNTKRLDIDALQRKLLEDCEK